MGKGKVLKMTRKPGVAPASMSFSGYISLSLLAHRRQPDAALGQLGVDHLAVQQAINLLVQAGRAQLAGRTGLIEPAVNALREAADVAVARANQVIQAFDGLDHQLLAARQL